MKISTFITVLALCLAQTALFGQQIRVLLNGNYYNDNDNVYINCSSGGFNTQIQYSINANWYAASHLNVDAAPSGWNWTFLPTNNTNKTSISFSQNYPTSSGQLIIE